MSNRSINLARREDICPAMDVRPLLHVVTWFYDYQPGMTIYAQRIAALSKHYRIELIARAPLTSNLCVPEGVPIEVVTVSDHDPLGIPKYCWKVAAILRRRGGRKILLLSSHLSMVALIARQSRVGIYWNEMPDHYFHRARFNKIRVIVKVCGRRMVSKVQHEADRS